MSQPPTTPNSGLPNIQEKYSCIKLMINDIFIMNVWEKKRDVISFSSTFPCQFWKNWKLHILLLHSFDINTVFYFCVPGPTDQFILTLFTHTSLFVMLSPTHKKLLYLPHLHSESLSRLTFTTKIFSLKIADSFRRRDVVPHHLLLLISFTSWSGNCQGCQRTGWYQSILANTSLDKLLVVI